ncbi:YwaF family protein [Pseudonocardia parietis]|uniref:Integral membrane protein (TIGR02206 family) n=1 Tax=Pseudonocardia parietis TaxID=570936 RepID=A0ABS4W4D1_9PSEU|nr:TIGR02206 family membrane protein [Pseudonocardia parietis]MBP2371082.1 putative integral membrane protein (TIGR02206 family) [Pseudonocardia parietis]
MDTAVPPDVFVPYGTTHWIVLGIGLVVAVLLVVAGRALRGHPAATTFARGFAIAILAFEIPLQIRLLTPAVWDIHISLPLQLSDLAWMTAAYALWSGRRWACAALYYWGLTLTPQALFTPALDAPDFPHVDFVAFWGLHLLLPWAAIYLTWGAGVRPTWRGMRTTLAITGVWAALTMTFNAVAGTNYGFLNHKPNNPSLLDLLGPWPWYVAVELVLVVVGWSLITWPWTRARSDVAELDHDR